MQIGVSLGLSQPWTPTSGSAGTFTLGSLSPLGLYDRRTSTVVDDGSGLLNSIANDGSAGGTFSQTTVSDKPSNLATGWPPDTTKPSIRFNGTDDHLVCTGISMAPASLTAAMLIYPTSLSDLGFGSAGIVFGATVQGGIHLQFTSGGAVEFVRPSVSAMGGTSAGAVSANNPYIIVCTYVQATGAMVIRVNGNATSSGTSVQTLTASTMVLGEQTAGYNIRAHMPVFYWNNKVETLDDQKKIEGRIAYDWGLRSLLPSDHPYKVNGPN